jgi:hypothetical protein
MGQLWLPQMAVRPGPRYDHLSTREKDEIECAAMSSLLF